MSALGLIIEGIGVAVGAAGAAGQGRASESDDRATADLIDQQAAATRHLAETTREQAARERIVAQQNEEDFRREQSRLMAKRRAEFGASGVEIGSGSPLLVSEDLAGETEVQSQRIRFGGEMTVMRFEQQADQFDLEAGFQSQQANLTRRAGASKSTGGLLRAGSLLLKGAGSIFGSSGISLG